MESEKEFFCSDLAWEHGIPLLGTATQGDIWFLLQYRGSWGSKAFEESTIPEDVKAYLSSFNTANKRLRILLLRQGPTESTAGITFFIGQTSAIKPRLYEYQLDQYEDILNLDLQNMALGKPGDPVHLRHKPLYLVCTNGRRDKCCSVYGPEVYQAMAQEAGKAVWQSSHIGGHNQAPIMLFFPHGVNYGHATPSEARRLVQAYQQGRIVLHHYRGRVCYDNHLQAAEHFWREQTGVLDLPGMKILSETQMGDDQWAVSLQGVDDEVINIQLVQRKSDFSIPITCTKKKESQIITFQRIE